MADLQTGLRSSRSINIGLRNVVLTILIGLGLVFVWQIRGTLMLTFAAVILVVLFTMPVRLLMDRFKMHRVVAIVVSVFGFFIILALLGVPILRTIGDQYEPLRTAVEGGLEQVRQSLTRDALLQQNSIMRDVIPIIDDLLSGSASAQPADDLIGQAVSQVTDAVGRLGGSVLPVVGGVANTILSVLIIFFLSMYLLAEPELYVSGIIKLTPVWYRERMLGILRRLDSTLRAWLSVTAVSMVVVAILTGLGLRLVGIQDEAFALGVLAGILSFIPNFGPVVALVPSVAVAILDAPQNVIWVVVIIYGVSFFQSQVISPVLASERMNMPAILVLLGQIIFGFFFGFLGLMLAVPLSACFAVIVDEMYVKDVLGDREPAKRNLDEKLMETEAPQEAFAPELS
ncbi:MAG: AI-2E family transporter [Chloroflexi bacterium]|nr:AI-2E family transporter [Chloroflexota bacterium]MCY3980023.1 AI-2E family transporter [Chloroflexota bacterium]